MSGDTVPLTVNQFKVTDYCADAFLHLFLDRWRVPPIVIPLFLAITVTLLEFAWAIPNDLLFGRDGIVGILDDPAFYYSNWLGGGTLWLYYAWMPGGIHTMFTKLRKNGVIKIQGGDEVKHWHKFISYVKKQLGSPWLSVIPLIIAFIAAFIIYFPSINNLQAWASQSLYGRLLVSAWMFVVLYAIIQVVLRQIFVTYLLSRMFKEFKENVNILPLHPDRAGGLAPLGSFALKSTYLITVIGFIVVFAAFNRQYQATGAFGGIRISSELIAAGVAYLIFAPITFLAPLATAHQAMREAKDNLLLQLSLKFEEVYRQTYQAVTDTCPDDLKLDRLKKVQEFHTLTEKFPVWPFNAATLQRFFASVLSPVVLAVLPSIVSALIK